MKNLNTNRIYGIFLSIILGCLLCVGQITAQGPTLTLNNTQNRFTGEYGTGSSKLFVEYQLTSANSSISRIKNSANQTLVESTRDNEIVLVKIAGVTLTVTMNKDNPDASTISEPTADEVQKLESFRVSAESENVRGLILELVKQKTGAEAAQIRGFIVIAATMGEGPNTQAKAPVISNPKSPNPNWIAAALQANSKQSDSGIVSTGTTCYCCGFGCACICWTAQCVVHDMCVERYGYFASRCFRALAHAVASIYYFC